MARKSCVGAVSRPILKLRQPHFDGVGAQLLRIFNSYAIAQQWKLDFGYEPLKSIGDEVFENGNIELEKWNSFLELLLPAPQRGKSRIEVVVNHKNHRAFILRTFIKMLEFAKVPATHIIDTPHVITNKNPHMLANLNFENTLQRFRDDEELSTIKIVLHIRQGELALSQFNDRYLPLAYFENFLADIIPRLKARDLAFKVIVTSEPGQKNLVSAHHPRVIESIRIDPNNPRLIRENEEFFRIIHEEPSWKLTPHLMNARWTRNNSSWDDFRLFLSADVLILSKSSFSYLAGLLNKQAIVVCPDFWHPPLPGWHSSSDTYEISSFLANKKCF